MKKIIPFTWEYDLEGYCTPFTRDIEVDEYYYDAREVYQIKIAVDDDIFDDELFIEELDECLRGERPDDTLEIYFFNKSWLVSKPSRFNL